MSEIGTARNCGALERGGNAIEWRVWAPKAKTVEVVLDPAGAAAVVQMLAEPDGFFTASRPEVPDGFTYVYRLDGGEDRADPCSLFQPQGVPGPSAVVRTSRFHWTDANWKGVPRQDLVFYELHVGTFTPEGTFAAIIPRLESLRELGVTAIELMPIGQFPGTRNWGYDGVLAYATQNSYGGPAGLQQLVDAAHAAGLAVFLDVVYNHTGPEASYLQEFAPYYNAAYKTPWGTAVNYDAPHCEPVRDWVLGNARMWLEEFHLDGLRLDAVHAIFDLGARHILAEIQLVAEDVATQQQRLTHVIAESDLNDPRLLYDRDRGGHQLSGQWSDDFHHAVHALLTGERRGYYGDYGTRRQLADVMNSPFLFAGHYSPSRHRRHGAPPAGLSGDRFVVAIQNHDQVGNRAKGDRLSTLLGSGERQRLAASLLLLSPYLPLLFMGEEYGEQRPFPFFCSFSGAELIKAVQEGRKREFADFVHSADEVPDPDAIETFQSAVLSWSWPADSLAAGIRQLYTDLLKARRTWPALRDFERRSASLRPDPQTGPLLLLERGEMRCWFNLSADPAPLPQPAGALRFSSESVRYGGKRSDEATPKTLLGFESVVVSR